MKIAQILIVLAFMIPAVSHWSSYLFPGAQSIFAAEPSGKGTIQLKLIAKHPHQKGSFCQGLLYDPDPESKDILLESTGLYTKSQLLEVDLSTGKAIRDVKVPDRCFAEGLALHGDHLYQLTWKERTCFIYDRKTFELVDEIRYPFEGWGLTTDGTELILSDGSDRLRFLDPKHLLENRNISVYLIRDGVKEKVNQLNELEWIDGEIWANVYQTNFVVRIDPQTGEVVGVIDFSALVPKELKNQSEYVLNGIAWDARGRRLFITGKCWSTLYEFQVE